LKTSGTPPAASASAAPPPPAPSGSSVPSVQNAGFTWYTFDEDREPCEQAVPRRPYFMNDDNIVYYYAYSGKTVPLNGASGAGGASGGVSGAISGSSALVPSIFTVLVVLIFSFC